MADGRVAEAVGVGAEEARDAVEDAGGTGLGFGVGGLESPWGVLGPWEAGEEGREMGLPEKLE
jgi:hypothetical protein